MLPLSTPPRQGSPSPSACACSSSPRQALPPHLQQRIATHPCYSEAAHHHYARMHVAVAPACNIQCNYCNRKFDCANESRPGVVSELLTPAEAAHKVLGCVDLSFEPKESTDEIEKTQEVPGQFVKTRK